MDGIKTLTHESIGGLTIALWRRQIETFSASLAFVRKFTFIYIFWTLHYPLLKHIEAETKWPPSSIRHFQMHFLEWNAWISLTISLKFVPKVPMNNIPALVLIMAWRRPGAKPLSEPVLIRLPTHICVARSQWVNYCENNIAQTAILLNMKRWIRNTPQRHMLWFTNWLYYESLEYYG